MGRLSSLLVISLFIACVPNGGSSPEGDQPAADAGPAETVCGDGILDDGEECDDGNRRNGDGCTSRCRVQAEPRCGDGNLDRLEECDDGNEVDTDGCTNTCANAKCGDGVQRTDIAEGQEGYEACDDGNETWTDACLNNCTVASCGDGVRRADLEEGASEYEACDDRNEETGDGCAACACEDLDADHGADPSGATVVEQGVEVAGVLACADMDYFRATVTEAGTYRFYTSSSIDTLCFLFDGEGQALTDAEGKQLGDDDSGAGYNCRILREMSENETVIVGVRYYGAEDVPVSDLTGTGAYTFMFRDLSDDHGNDAANGTPITVDAPVTGEIEMPGDVDVFTFTATSSGMMEFGTNSEMDPICVLADATGAEEHGANDDIDTEARQLDCLIAHEVVAETSYTFWVRHWERSPDQPGNTGLYEAFVRPQE